MAKDNADAARGLAQRFWEGLLALEPMVGTYIGDDRYDDKLPDPSEEGIAKKKAFLEKSLADRSKIDAGGLDVELRTSLDVLENGCRRELNSIRWRMDRFSAVTHLFGPGNLLADIGSLQRADSPERVEKFAGRLSAIPTYLAAIGKVADEGAQPDGSGRKGADVQAVLVQRGSEQLDLRFRGRLFRLPDTAEEPGPHQTGDQSQDDDDHQQFDEREAALAADPGRSFADVPRAGAGD